MFLFADRSLELPIPPFCCLGIVFKVRNLHILKMHFVPTVSSRLFTYLFSSSSSLCLSLVWTSHDFLCLLKDTSCPVTMSAGSGTLQYRCTFTSSLFKKLLGSLWKLYLQILRMSILGACPSPGWSLNTWFHCGSSASLLLDSVILCDVYGVSKKAALEAHRGGLFSGSHFFFFFLFFSFFSFLFIYLFFYKCDRFWLFLFIYLFI